MGRSKPRNYNYRMRKFDNIEDLKRDTRAGYTVPDGYFENLPMRIQQRCIDEQKSSFTEVVKVGILSIIKPYLLMGSFMITLLIGIYTVNTFLIPSDQMIVTPALSENGSYKIEDMMSQFNESDLTAFVDEAEMVSAVNENYSGEAVEFLIDENIDYSTLIEECK